MKKYVSLMLAVAFTTVTVFAQNVADGVKHLYYERYKSAKETLSEAVKSNPKDANAIYWLGQSMIATDNAAGAKELYQKALNDGINEPIIWVGVGHIELLEGKNNEARQRFESAITASTTKKRRETIENPEILTAIGKANADGSSKIGDPVYGIEKLKRAAEIDKTNPDIYYYMGISYLKLGGDRGGEAVVAFNEALNRNPNYAKALLRIGRIYKSQNNTDLFKDYCFKAIVADETYAPVYLELFDAYAEKDVNAAKEYLDKFIKYADKDPQNDFFLADYLFRAGKYDESIAKAKEIESQVGGIQNLPRLNILYAYNYDKKGDSVQAKTFIEQFFSMEKEAKIQPRDYVFAGKLMAKFPGSEDAASLYLTKAIDQDTVTANRIEYATIASDIFGKAKRFGEQLKWQKKIYDLKNGDLSLTEFYYLCKATFDAKEYDETIKFGKAFYISNPEKAYPYACNFIRNAAIASDADTTSGSALAQLDYVDSVYAVQDVEKNKKSIFINLYYRLLFYIKKSNTLKGDYTNASTERKEELKAEIRTTTEKAIAACDKMINLYPNDGEEKTFATSAKAELEKSLQSLEAGNSKSNSK